LGYAFKADKMVVGPFGSMQYTVVGLNAFSEQGSQAPLTVPAQSTDSLLGQWGLQAGGYWKMGSATLNPQLRVAYEHEFDYRGGTFQAGFGAGDHFVVAGPLIGQDGILVGAGASLDWGKGLSLSLDYQGELNRTNLTSNQLGGGVQVGF
jgi:outer membrane autotransporter protein